MTAHEPDTLFPVSIRPHPAAAAAEEDMRRWLDGFGLCRAPGARATLHRARVAHCIGLFHPEAPQEAIRLLSRVAGWSLMIDEEFDSGPARTDPAACAAAVTAILGALAPIPEPGRFTVRDTDDAMTRAAADLRRSLESGCPVGWSARFHAHMADWMWGIYAEVVDRTAGRRPALAELRERRRDSYGLPWYLDLCEIAVGVYLPEAVHRLPAFRALSAAACDITALCNDRASADRERTMGDVHSVVLLLEDRHGMSPAQAASRADEMITEDAERIRSAYRDLPGQLRAAGLDGPTARDAMRCADGYLDMVRGNHAYHRTCGRYTEPDALPDSASRAEGFAASPTRTPR